MTINKQLAPRTQNAKKTRIWNQSYVSTRLKSDYNKRMKRFRLWSVILLCIPCIFLIYSFYTPTLYVSKSGSDTNPGTKSHPLKTIQVAASRVSQSGGTIRVASGIYRETVDISAINGQRPIHIKGIDDDVEISGSEPSSSLSWDTCTSALCPEIPSNALPHTYVAILDWPEQPTMLTEKSQSEQDQQLSLARTPNIYITDPNKYHEHWWQPDANQQDQTIINDPVHAPSLPDITGARALIMDGQDRCGTFLYQRSVNRHYPGTSTITLDNPIGALTYGRQEIGLSAYSKYFVENIPGLLDSPGEWFYDKDHRRLFVWPIEQKNPKDLQIEIGRRNIGIRINRSNVYIDKVRIKNINDSSYYSSFTGGIVINPENNIHTIRLSNLSLAHVGNGIAVEPIHHGSVHDIFINSSKFDRIGNSGIALIGGSRPETNIDTVDIGKSIFTNSGFLINESAINVVRAKGIHIHDTIIHDVAGTGIHVTGFEKQPYTIDDVTIARNSVERACQNGSGCSAIKIFGGNFSNTFITHNTVRNNMGWSFCQEATQPLSGFAMGIFISNASGISVTDNISSHNSGPAILAFTRQLPSTRNIFRHNTASHSLTGISLDGDSGNIDTDESADSYRHKDSIISDNTFIQNDIALRLDPADPKDIGIYGNTYDKNTLALSYKDIQVTTPSAIKQILPSWEH